MCDFEQSFVLGVKVLAGGELSYGACNHRQRGAELVGDVGEETHVHLVGALFLFLLHLGFPGGALGSHDAAGIAVEVGCQQCRQREIDEPSPPGVCRCGSYHDAQRALIRGLLVAGSIGGLHAEGVSA